MVFDRSQTYQFALFFRESTEEPSAEALRKLPDIVTDMSGIEDSLGLTRLTRVDSEASFIVGDMGLVPAQQTVWQAGGGIWKLLFQTNRLDLHFNAGEYTEIIGSDDPPSYDAVRERVIPILNQACTLLGKTIARIGIVYSGESSCRNRKSPAEIVARVFYNSDTINETAAGNILDISARINRFTQWSLPTASGSETEIRVNRIEEGQARWRVTAGHPDTTLHWRLDVNISPMEALEGVTFKNNVLDAFSNHAIDWMSERITHMSEIENE
jgi:hypothetical protein